MVPVRLAAVTLLNPDAFPLMKFVTIEFIFEIPETLRLVRVPTDVIFS